MAPELLQNRTYNRSVDVYAYGMLLWELFSYEVPYQGFELADIRDVVLSGERPAIPRGDTPQQVSFYAYQQVCIHISVLICIRFIL
jgi:serine/threonine protein kinase